MKTFQSFRLDSTNHCLWNGEERVRIAPKAFDVLRYLVENPERLVTQDELLEALWPDTYVNPEVLRKYILEVRKILGDRSDRPEFIETLPKRGYRFVAAVSDDVAVEPIPASAAGVADEVFDEAPDEVPSAPTKLAGKDSADSAATANAHPLRWRILAGVAMVAVALGLAAWVYFSRRALGLTEKDSVVLADFVNSTDDPIFDDTLKTALNISLRQSPFLNVLPDSEVATTLALMTRPAGHETDARSSAGALSTRGQQSLHCRGDRESGQRICGGVEGGELPQWRHASRGAGDSGVEGEGARTRWAGRQSKLRSELGESLATVQKLDVPLEQATTSSLEALQAYQPWQKRP